MQFLEHHKKQFLALQTIPGGPADADDDLPLLAPPDVHIFTTWTPHSWSSVNFDEITFPADTAINIRTVQSYMAVTMILWYDTELRTKYDRVWEALKYAWLATTFFWYMGFKTTVDAEQVNICIICIIFIIYSLNYLCPSGPFGVWYCRSCVASDSCSNCQDCGSSWR